jgi:phospholipid/cholesterol/gamma-HCH transport system substrate-binding protein
VLLRATPVVGSLARLSSALAPVSNILNHSVDNILAVVENWSRAIQLRDGLSHVFRGEASMTTDTLTSMIDRLAGHPSSDRGRAARPAPGVRAAGPAPAPAGPRGQGPRTGVAPSPSSRLGAVTGLLNRVTGTLGGLLKGNGSPSPPSAHVSSPGASSSPSSVSSLLKYLLGS